MAADYSLVNQYLKPILPLFKIDGISEIMVNNYQNIFIEVKGKLEKTNVSFPDENAVTVLIEQIATATGQPCDPINHPIVDAKLKDGSRVCAILSSISSIGSALSIRVFNNYKLSFDDLISFGSLNKEMVFLLKKAVEDKNNILISGSTGSGKTTFLNLLSVFIYPHERVVSAEDTAELKIKSTNWVPLIAPNRKTNKNDSQKVSLGSLIKTALRLNPDRLIVGEIRDFEAASAFITAINTGHSGCFSTIHANDPHDSLIRMQSLISQKGLSLDFCKLQIVNNINLIVQLKKVYDYGRVVTNISKIENGNIEVLWEFDLISKIHVKNWSSKTKVVNKLKETT